MISAAKTLGGFNSGTDTIDLKDLTVNDSVAVISKTYDHDVSASFEFLSAMHWLG